jgi:hypothetical protein
MKFIHGLIFGIVIMYILNEIKKKCILSTSKSELVTIIQILSRQAARWSTAAEQDESPLVAVLHANYGAGYLWALKDIANTEQINAATGIDMLKFEREIVSAQDNATKRMVKLCPDFGPKRTYLTQIGGE